jgi:hypothetical protein
MQFENIYSAGSQTEEVDEEVERHSIAVDMRTMKEMHETMKSLNWKLPQMQQTSKILPVSRGTNNLPTSPPKVGMTHSTLFNQYNLPDYMLHSPPFRINNRKSNHTSKH